MGQEYVALGPPLNKRHGTVSALLLWVCTARTRLISAALHSTQFPTYQVLMRFSVAWRWETSWWANSFALGAIRRVLHIANDSPLASGDSSGVQHPFVAWKKATG